MQWTTARKQAISLRYGLLALNVFGAYAATDVLSQIREKMAGNLAQVPNYTCTETIERSEKQSPRKKFQPLDKVRLEVALVGGRELLSWPGAGKFEERDLGDFVSGGTTASGDYALHAQTIFRTNKPTFRAAGEENLDGRRAVRFEYDVVLAKSEFLVRTGDKEARVPYHGSFWADPATLDLIRLDILVDAAPRELDVARASTEIRYRQVKVGQSDFLLPRVVDLVLQRNDGGERRNRTEFADCRQYVGESVIIFDDPDLAAGILKGPPQEIELPAGLEFETQLTGAINFKTAVVGDPVNARAQGAAKKDGKILIPKGAVFHGRIRQMLQHGDYALVGIEIFEVEFENKKAALLCQLRSAGPIPGVGTRSLSLVPQTEPNGIGAMIAQIVRIGSLPNGFRMIWSTLPKSK